MGTSHHLPHASARPTLSVIGAGRVGKTLAHVLHQRGHVFIGDILNRSLPSAERAAAFIGSGRAVDQLESFGPATLYLLAPPDDQIRGCAEQLAASGRIDARSIVFHCSGALGSDVLRAASHAGAAVASLHPIRSFADPTRVAPDFAGTHFGVEGDVRALTALVPLLEAAGAHCVPIRPEAKTLYHAAAVFGSNYLVTLLGAARDAYVEAGIPAELALRLLLPLTTETIENAFRLGPEAALTGPIARGDNATVARQQQALLAWDGGHCALYRALAEATYRLAAGREMQPPCSATDLDPPYDAA